MTQPDTPPLFVWSAPNSLKDGSAYSETGAHFIVVTPDGRLVFGDKDGTTEFPAGVVAAIRACAARAAHQRNPPSG